MIDLSLLNDDQREAVLDFDHNLLLLACAGSGKTRTITTKIAYAIEEKLYRPAEILGVTFTNRAAKEMKDRVDSMVDNQNISHLEIRTFHSLGAYLLRLFSDSVGLSPDFCIYDDEDSLSLLSSVSPKDRKYLKAVYRDIAMAKDNGFNLESPTLSYQSDFPDFVELFSSYQEALSRTGNVDFADLIAIPRKELEKTDSLMRRYCHSRFRYILVDEYQDSNTEQFRFLKALKSEDAKITVVGDDDQSIYSFRGANIQNILTFSKMFDNVREIKIEKNYRSTSEILAVASSLIKKNTSRHKKEIISADGKTGTKPCVMNHYNGFEEAHNVVASIEANGDYDNTAILYRTNAQSGIFEKELLFLHIPYKIIGALRFYEREEIKDAIAFLYLLLNHKDIVSFRRIINKPSRGIGEKKQESIISLDEDLTVALKEFTDKNSKSDGAKTFLDGLLKAEEDLNEEKVELGVMLHNALERIGLIEYYHKIEDRTQRESKERNLEEFFVMLNRAGRGKADLSRFLEELTLDRTKLGNNDPRDEEGVTLITMHNTKGLEFDNVYCVGLEEDYLPGRNALSDEVEEERRILYVAMTRARKELYLSYANSRSRWGNMATSALISPFLKEVPVELLRGNLIDLKDKKKSYNHQERGSSWSSGNSSWIKKDASKFSVSEFAHKIDAINIPEEKRKGKPEKRVFAKKLETGDRVKNANYGEGYVSEKIIRPNGAPIIVVKFGQRSVKFIEGNAPLEKI